MSYALVAHAVSGQPFGGITATTPARNTVGANFIIIACGWVQPTPMVPTDSQGNTWTPLPQYSFTQTNARFFYCINPSTSSNHIFTLTNGIGSTFPVMAVQAWSGVNSFDVQNGGTGGPSTQPVTAGPVTPAGNGELIISSEVSINSATISVDSGFTLTDFVPNVGHGLGIAMSYLEQGSAATVNPTWTGQGVAIQVANVAAFTPSTTSPITLTMGSGVGVKGGSIALNLSIASTGTPECTGIEWTFGFSSDVSLAGVTLGAAGTGASKTLSRNGGLCIVWGVNTNVIADGVLATATFNIVPNPLSSSITINILNIVATDASGNALGTTGIPGTITFQLPSGFVINPDGTVTGVPTQAGTYCYTAQVMDSSSPAQTATVTCCVTVGTGTPCSQFSPPVPETDTYFELRRLYVTMKPDPHIRVRGS